MYRYANTQRCITTLAKQNNQFQFGRKKKTTVEILEHDKFLFARVITLRIVSIVSFICQCSFKKMSLFYLSHALL